MSDTISTTTIITIIVAGLSFTFKVNLGRRGHHSHHH